MVLKSLNSMHVSNSFADTFYKVRTSISSTIDSSFSRTLRYEKSQHEGGTHREIVVEYDYKKGEAKYVLLGKSPKITPIPGPVFDPLSIAYFFACTHYYLEEI